MAPDDLICYCHKVPLVKLWHFARRLRPSRPSQMSECLGAGTGCGWCIPFLKKIHERAVASDPHAAEPQEPFGADVPDLADLSPEDYAQQRRRYIDTGQPRNTF